MAQNIREISEPFRFRRIISQVLEIGRASRISSPRQCRMIVAYTIFSSDLANLALNFPNQGASTTSYTLPFTEMGAVLDPLRKSFS